MKPDGQALMLAQVTLQTRAVPRSRQVPVWQGDRPGVQSSPNKPPNGAQIPLPDLGPVAVRLSAEQS